MSPAAWAVAVLMLISFDTLAIAYLIRSRGPRQEQPWFDHSRFVDRALADRVKAYSRPAVIVHPCSYGGDLIEYPIHAGFLEDAVLSTLAEIEAL